MSESRPPEVPQSETRNEGISPVVGAILMVAITVVLAAVILFFLTGLSNPTAPATAGFSISEQSDGVHVTLLSVGTGDSFEMRVNGAVVHTWTRTDVGSEVVLTGVGPGDEVTFVGTNEDKQTVVRNYDVARPAPGATPQVTTGSPPSGGAPVAFVVASSSDWGNGTLGPNAAVSSLTFAETDTRTASVTVTPRVIDQFALETGPTISKAYVSNERSGVAVYGDRIYSHDHDRGTGQVFAHDMEGNLLWSYNPTGADVNDIHVDSSGHILVGSDGVVTKIDPSGNMVWEAIEDGAGYHLEVGPNDNIVTSGTAPGAFGSTFRGVRYLDGSSGANEWFETPSDSVPDIYRFDSAGNVYVANNEGTNGADRLYKFSPSGTQLESFTYDTYMGDEYTQATGLYMNPDGTLTLGLSASYTNRGTVTFDSSLTVVDSTIGTGEDTIREYSEPSLNRMYFLPYDGSNMAAYDSTMAQVWSYDSGGPDIIGATANPDGRIYAVLGNQSAVVVAETVDTSYTSERFDASESVTWQNATVDVSTFDDSVSYGEIEFRFSNDPTNMNEQTVTKQIAPGQTNYDFTTDPAFGGVTDYQYVEFEVTMWTVDDTNIVIESVSIQGEAP